MNRKTITTTVASLSLMGAGLALVAPADAANVSARPADERCARYPGSVVTVTKLRLREQRIERGERNVAIVKVDAQRGTPRGAVKVVHLPASGEGKETRIFDDLNDQGVARVKLPKNLERGRYGVRAKYVPGSCSKFQKSASGVKFYRVTRRS